MNLANFGHLKKHLSQSMQSFLKDAEKRVNEQVCVDECPESPEHLIYIIGFVEDEGDAKQRVPEITKSLFLDSSTGDWVIGVYSELSTKSRSLFSSTKVRETQAVYEDVSDKHVRKILLKKLRVFRESGDLSAVRQIKKVLDDHFPLH